MMVVVVVVVIMAFMTTKTIITPKKIPRKIKYTTHVQLLGQNNYHQPRNSSDKLRFVSAEKNCNKDNITDLATSWNENAMTQQKRLTDYSSGAQKSRVFPIEVRQVFKGEH
jgi:glucose dehydrogenase